MTHRSVVRATLALVLVAGCTCSTRPTRNAEEFVPVGADGALSIPHVGRLSDGIAALVQTARSGPGGAQVVKAAADVGRMLGFDPFTRDGLRQAGIEADASLAAGGNNLSGVLALPIADKAKIEATITRLAGDRLGATEKSSVERDGIDVTVLKRPGEDAPEVAYTLKDGFALVSTGPEAVGAVAGAATLRVEDSVAKAGPLSFGKERIGQRQTYLYVPGSSLTGLASNADAVVFGADFSAHELGTRTFIALPTVRAEAVKKLLVGGGTDALNQLPDAAPLHLRAGIDWSAIPTEARKGAGSASVLNEVRAFLEEGGIELETEVLPLLEPGFALSVGLGRHAVLGQLFDLRRRGSLLDGLDVTAVFGVKAPEAAAKLLPKLAGLIAAQDYPVEERDVAGTKAWTVRDHEGGELVSWALKGKSLVFAPTGGLEALLGGRTEVALDEGRFEPRAKEALFGKPGGAFALDFAQLAKGLQQLPTSAFGTGPGALMARSAATQIVQPLSRIKTVAALAPTEGGVILDVAINGK